MIQCLMPDEVLKHTGAASVSELSLLYEPNGLVVIRKREEPKKIPDEIVEKCKEYICQQIRDFFGYFEFFFTYNRNTKRTTAELKRLNMTYPSTLVGNAKHNINEDVFCAEVGIAIALCRALNGKKCDYEKIIGIKMA